jgi:ankyrin repeat protein
MRLLQIQANGSFSLVNHEGTSTPPYAILSHTWSENNEDEVSYDDMCKETGGEKSGYAKLKFCAERATQDGLEHFWVDTCCINKSSSAELSEAITSMFRWYKNSAQCYVYLTDVTTKKRKSDRETPDATWESTFRTSRWFTRGWTLQELLAPRLVLFFSRDRELLGTKFSLVQLIHEITHIPILTLRGAPLHDFSVEERMSWAKNRITKREEDSAYSLLGIFGVSMAAIYGEGKAVALRRLEKKIIDVVQNQISPPGDVKRQALMESLRFDQIDARYATVKNAHAKTCKWLLQKSEHTEWLDPGRLPHHHGFLWIKGKPGTGKSTLMKFAFSQASKSKKRNVVVAFFFNARGEVLEKTIIGMYRSLLLQLLEKIPTLQCNPGSLSLVPSSIGADYQWTRHSLEDQLQQAVLSLGETPVMCFIDALDECEQWQVRSMISFFEHLGELAVSSGRSFRVCLSSRHYPEVNIRMGISLVLEGQEGHNQDINNYLESALRIGTSTAAQKIRNNLQEKSRGVFMWVVLVVEILNEEYDGGRMYALERRLKQIPADLHELFRDILTRDSNDKEELILCIQWVLFAKQPLQPEQLYYAILAGIEPDALTSQHCQEVTADTIRRFLLRSSKGLTEITKSKNTKVQFIHESVRDFLLKENGLSKIWPEFTSNFQGQSHERLKQCCYNHISIDVATPLKLPSNLPKASLPESADLRKSAAETFPFLEYAVHNVLYHSDTAEGGGISQADFLISFPLLEWAELNNLFEKHEVRRHTSHVSLLYVLAELNMANLIGVSGLASNCMVTELERYGCPLFAAAATSSEQALDLCLESIEVQDNYTSLVAEVDKQQSRHKSTRRVVRREFVYSKSRSLLVNAGELDHGRVLAVLIASGKLDIDSQDSMRRTALWWASRNRYEMLARLLLAVDSASINSWDKSNSTPLIVAVEQFNLEIVRMLLEKGADIHANSQGVSALYVASSAGYSQIVSLLLDKGANVDLRTDGHDTAIQIALAKGHIETAMLLFEKGANVNAQGGIRGNALQVALAMGHKEIAMRLLAKGADINVQGGFYGNALQAASANRQNELVALLLERGADVNAQGGEYGSALQAATYDGCKEIVMLLLDKGANINAQGGRYGTALHTASRRSFREIVELLLERGAAMGNVLETATNSGRTGIVKLLLENGAGGISSALQIASGLGHTDIVALLREHSVVEGPK